MPLIKSCSKKARKLNIEELIHSGRKPNVAAAIAYSICKNLKKKKK